MASLLFLQAGGRESRSRAKQGRWRASGKARPPRAEEGQAVRAASPGRAVNMIGDSCRRLLGKMNEEREQGLWPTGPQRFSYGNFQRLFYHSKGPLLRLHVPFGKTPPHCVSWELVKSTTLLLGV